MNNLQLPNLLIAGVHKAGTTSLHTYLSMHPDVCGSLKKELAFLLPARYGKPVPGKTEYAGHFMHCSGQRYILETTPSYIYGGLPLIENIYKNLGNAVRVMVILRDPLERFVSFYKHCLTKLEIPETCTLTDFINQSHTSITGIRTSENISHLTQGIVEGYYADFLKDWFEHFGDRLKIIFFDDLRNDTPKVMQDICSWLDIDYGFYSPDDFEVENRTAYYRLSGVHQAALWINYKTEAFWRRNIRLKRALRKLYYSINEKKNVRDSNNSEAIDLLNNIYKTPNAELKILLNKYGISNLPAWAG